MTKTVMVWFLSGCETKEKETNAMTDALRIALSDLLRKAQIEEDADFLREGMRVFAQAVMEAGGND